MLAVAHKGGVENIINIVAPYLTECGWDVRIVQLVWEKQKWADKSIPFYALSEGRGNYSLDDMVHSYSDFIDENGSPDIVLATAWPYMSYVAKQAGVLVGRNITVISWLHAPLWRYTAVGFGDVSALVYADAHFAISQGIYNELSRITDRAILRVNNTGNFFEDITDSAQINSSEKSGSTKKLFFIGRIAPEKHIETIIDSLAKSATRDWELHVIGDAETSDLTTSLKDYSEKIGVKNSVIWHGWSAYPWTVAAAADAVILASEYEGFPLVLVEALANGKPVISTPVDAAKEIITPGKNGWLFNFNDSDMLAEILDGISSEQLPIPNADCCRNSVKSYKKETALVDFEKKLFEIVSSPYRSELKNTADILFFNDRISVIIPCYNSSEYITACINSLMGQTYPLHLIELIFVDDASTDNTSQIIKEYEKKYPQNILFIECTENGRQGRARNIGMSYATGEYIVFMDSDDIAAPDMLETLYIKIKLYDCDFVGAGYTMFSEDGEKNVLPKNCYYNLSNAFERKKAMLEIGTSNSIWGKMYKKHFLAENNIYFPEQIYMEDLYFYTLCLMTSGSFLTYSKSIYKYRQNPSGTMFSPSVRNYYLDTYYVEIMTLNELRKRGLFSGYEEELGLIFYVKAFVEPVRRMLSNEHGILYDKDIVRKITNTMLKYFPDIMLNPYILQDTSDYNKTFLDIIRNESD